MPARLLSIIVGMSLSAIVAGCGHSNVASALGSDAWGPGGQTEPPVREVVDFDEGAEGFADESAGDFTSAVER